MVFRQQLWSLRCVEALSCWIYLCACFILKNNHGLEDPLSDHSRVCWSKTEMLSFLSWSFMWLFNLRLSSWFAGILLWANFFSNQLPHQSLWGTFCARCSMKINSPVSSLSQQHLDWGWRIKETRKEKRKKKTNLTICFQCWALIMLLVCCIAVLSWHCPGDRGTRSEDPSSGAWAWRCGCISWFHLLLRWPSSWGTTASGEGQFLKLNPEFLTFLFYSGSWNVNSDSSASYIIASLFLQCPVLIAWGDKDPWEPIELGRNYANYDRVEDFVVLPNVGHCPQVSLFVSHVHTCIS